MTTLELARVMNVLTLVRLISKHFFKAIKTNTMYCAWNDDVHSFVLEEKAGYRG